MKDVYQLSGVPMSTNSNSYIIDVGEELLLIDAGFSELQWKKMEEMLKFWKLDSKPITHTFLTHCHFDHAGNAWRARALGSRILAGPSDAEAIEAGDRRCIGYMFQKEFKPCKVDEKVKNKQIYRFGEVALAVIHTPGHSEGSVVYKAKVHDKIVLFLGDFIAIEPVPPKDEIQVALSWTGAPDFSAQSYLRSLRTIAKVQADVLCTGHYHIFYADCNQVLEMALKKGEEEFG